MSEDETILCPHCGHPNPRTEGRAGVPVCTACHKALPEVTEYTLESISEEDLDLAPPPSPQFDLQDWKKQASEILNQFTRRQKAIAGGTLAGVIIAVMGWQAIFGAPEAPRKSCNKGDLEACVALGHLYEQDETLQDRLEEALSLYRRACVEGSDVGCRTLFRFLSDYPSIELACREDETRCHAVKALLP